MNPTWEKSISPEQLPTTIKNVTSDIIGCLNPDKKQYTEEELLAMPYGAVVKKLVESHMPEFEYYILTTFINLIKDNEKLNVLVPSLTALVEEGLKQGVLIKPEFVNESHDKFNRRTRTF